MPPFIFAQVQYLKNTGFANSFNKSCTIANVFCNGYDNIEMKWVAVIEFSQAYYLLP